MSPAWKLFEDPVPRLALLLPCHQALLVYRVPWDIHPHAQTALLLGLARTTVIVAVAQFTAVIAAGQLTPLRRKSLGMYGFAMLGLGTRRIFVSIACLCGSRDSLATRREPEWSIPAKASDEERMLLYRINSEVVNFPYIANARDESAKLAERDSLLGIDYCYEGAAICGVRTERSLG